MLEKYLPTSLESCSGRVCPIFLQVPAVAQERRSTKHTKAVGSFTWSHVSTRVVYQENMHDKPWLMASCLLSTLPLTSLPFV